LYASARVKPDADPPAALIYDATGFAGAAEALQALLPRWPRAIDERFKVQPLPGRPNGFAYRVEYPQPALLCLARALRRLAGDDRRPAGRTGVELLRRVRRRGRARGEPHGRVPLRPAGPARRPGGQPAVAGGPAGRVAHLAAAGSSTRHQAMKIDENCSRGHSE
jgi:hypothetical protein